MRVRFSLERQVDVGERLGLDALGGVDDEDRALAGLEGVADLVGEVDVAGRVDEVEAVGQAVARLVLEADGPRLDRDPLLALEVHRVEDLAHHLAPLDRVRQLEQPVRERGLAVIDVGDDREVAQAVLGDGHEARIVLRSPARFRPKRRRPVAAGEIRVLGGFRQVGGRVRRLGGVDADRGEEPFEARRRRDHQHMQVVGVRAECMCDAVRTVHEVARPGLDRLVADEPPATTGDHEPGLVVDLMDVTARRSTMSRHVLLHDEHASGCLFSRRLYDHQVPEGPDPPPLPGPEVERPVIRVAHLVPPMRRCR